MATLTTPRKTTDAEHVYHAIDHVGLLTRGEVAEVEAEIAAILAPAAPAATPALPHKEGRMIRIVRPFVSLYRELSGPPMTERDRQARALAETGFRTYAGMGGF